MVDKNAKNEVFKQFLPFILWEAIDDRLYVKKAVNWALRNIGKRNRDLHLDAMIVAKNLSVSEIKSAKWIGNNALIQLGQCTLNVLDYPRLIYRNDSEKRNG